MRAECALQLLEVIRLASLDSDTVLIVCSTFLPAGTVLNTNYHFWTNSLSLLRSIDFSVLYSTCTISMQSLTSLIYSFIVQYHASLNSVDLRQDAAHDIGYPSVHEADYYVLPVAQTSGQFQSPFLSVLLPHRELIIAYLYSYNILLTLNHSVHHSHAQGLFFHE